MSTLKELQQACLLSSEEAADLCQRIMDTEDLDKLPWEQVHLLAALVERCAVPESISPLMPRLSGVRKYLWTRNQAWLKRCVEVLGPLRSQGLDVLLLGSVADVAADPSLASYHPKKNLSVLLRLDQMTEGSQCLLRQGYVPLKGKLPGRQGYVLFRAPQEDHELTVYDSLFRYGRKGRFEEAVWSRAQKIVLGELELLVPHPVDRFLIWLLDDGHRESSNLSEGLLCLRHPAFSWGLFLTEVQRRQLHVPVGAALEELATHVRLKLPTNVQQSLDSADFLLRREYRAERRRPIGRNFWDKVFSWLAEHRRSRGQLR